MREFDQDSNQVTASASGESNLTFCVIFIFFVYNPLMLILTINLSKLIKTIIVLIKLY